MTIAFPFCEKMDDILIEKGRRLFASECRFVKGVVAMDGLPKPDRVEICFAGRSNVGKSTLINSLTNRKALARSSNTPGRTQELAQHAERTGAAAISAVCPGTYAWTGEQPVGLAGCASFWKELAASTSLPFYAYWFGMDADPPAFLRAVADIPSFAGLKYTAKDMYTFQQIADCAPAILGRRLNMLSGPDECNLAAAAMGADGAIGSTYNLCPALYVRMRAAFEGGQNAKALALQAQANRMIATLILHTRPQRLLTNFVAGLKAVLREQHGLGAAGYARARSVDGFTPEHEAELLVAIKGLGFELE
jgi:dihydrodipicolinate synthase/N-acetylneuraminate lyase